MTTRDGRRGWRRVIQILPLMAAVTMLASPSLAQSAPAAAGGGSARVWEIEAYGGLSVGHSPTGGTSSLPPAGPPITTTGVTFPSRATSSWFFGDGATLLNDTMQELGLTQRLTPLDSALSTLGLSGGRSAAFGFRVRRAVTRRLAVEFALDVLPGSASVPASFLTAAESTRASFVSAFQTLFLTGPFTAPNVSATTTMTGGSRREMSVTGAMVFPFRARGGFTPYLTAGGGLLMPQGDSPSVAIQGSYATTVTVTGAPIAEHDTVTVHFDTQRVPIVVAGGGLSRALSKSAGIRVDARVLMGPNPARTSIDATPSVSTATPGGVIQTGSSPSVQFSNNPATGRVSSLSGGALTRFPVLTGGGWETRVLATASIFFRF